LIVIESIGNPTTAKKKATKARQLAEQQEAADKKALEGFQSRNVRRAVELWHQDTKGKLTSDTLADWVRFVIRYQDRVLWGSDSVIYTRNKIDAADQIVQGGPMSVEDYRAVSKITEPLWQAVGPDVARKVKGNNHIRVFDDARQKVRAWESANAGQDIWNLQQ
jgi:hypothetical protein